MDKSTQSIPDAKKVTIAQLDGVKPLLMKGADDDDDDHGADRAAEALDEAPAGEATKAHATRANERRFIFFILLPPLNKVFCLP